MSIYVAADVHGGFTELWGALRRKGFNPQEDSVYSLGDLVNRGAESRFVTEWLKKPWFKPVRGNHEEMIIRAWTHPEDEANNGVLRSVNADWWFSMARSDQEVTANGLACLPYFRELNVQGCRVGFVHADVPEQWSWPQFCDRLGEKNSEAINVALWSRARWKDGVQRGLSDGCLPNIRDVDWVFVGHSPVDKPTIVGNVVYTDCGLWRGNDAGVFCLDDWLLEHAN